MKNSIFEENNVSYGKTQFNLVIAFKDRKYREKGEIRNEYVIS
jgi:hypothetical protein